MKIVGIITSYFPNIDVLEDNISTYLEFIDNLIIWENTPVENSLIKEKIKDNKKIIIKTTGQNEGVGKAP